MRNKKVRLIVLVITLTAFVCMSGMANARAYAPDDSVSSLARNLDTDEEFATIREAINDSDTSDGHTIRVVTGTYNENIVVDKSLTIRSVNENAGDTLVQTTNPSEYEFNVSADSVNIIGFTVEGGGEFKAGICLNSISHCNITENKISSNSGDGISMDSSFKFTTVSPAGDEDNPPVAVGLDSIKDQLIIAYGYKAGEGVGGWTVYNPEWVETHPEWNTLTTLYVGRGYWINVSEGWDLTYGGNTYHLDEGWNLIGWLPSPSCPPTTDKMALWNLTGGPQLRGANIYQRRVYPELDGLTFMGPGAVGPPYTQEDFDRLAALGANYVNISHPGLFSETAPYTLDQDIQHNLDNLLDMIAKVDMFAVISFRTGPGRSEFTFFWDEVGDWFDESYLNDSMWQDQAAQDAWVAMWRYTSERYRDNPIVVGYDLMVEPNANEVGSDALNDPLDIWDPEEFYANYGGTLYDWNQLYPRITTAIREVDASTPILIGGMSYSAVEWFPYLEPTGDPRTVYVAHQYAPVQYTHQLPPLELSYPGLFDTDWDGVDDQFNRAWLEDLLSTVDTFTATHGVPVAVNEFGLMRWEPGAADFMDDQMDLFEQRGMNHALWCWDPSWEEWVEEVDAFNFRHGPDPNNHADVESSDLIDVIVGYWGRNTMRPSNTTFTTENPLRNVQFWAYQLQDISEPGAVDALADSHYDMLVLEPTRTDWSSDDKYFDTKGMVERLKNTKASDGIHGKLIIAYIDIGEAEDWRWYWNWSKEWPPGEPRPDDWPDYILTHDPDGWEGNYPVAYWDERWKDIVIHGRSQNSSPYGDYNSVIDEVIKDGFDGIYLDWVEGFENDAVIEEAQNQGKDPAVEMINFIQEMRDYAAQRMPNFIIIQQNAAALCDEHPELFSKIDAISQEAIWYDGDAFDDWNAPDAYDIPNDLSLTNYYLEYLDQYEVAGLTVFNCEYALNYADEAYNKSYDKGYIPYCTRRALSKLTTTSPPGYRGDEAYRVDISQSGSLQNPAWSPDGKSILFTRFRNGVIPYIYCEKFVATA